MRRAPRACSATPGTPMCATKAPCRAGRAGGSMAGRLDTGAASSRRHHMPCSTTAGEAAHGVVARASSTQGRTQQRLPVLGGCSQQAQAPQTLFRDGHRTGVRLQRVQQCGQEGAGWQKQGAPVFRGRSQEPQAPQALLRDRRGGHMGAQGGSYHGGGSQEGQVVADPMSTRYPPYQPLTGN